MTPSPQNALSALNERLRQRGIWAGALVVPGLGIPVLVAFALPGEGPQTLEKALWLLAILPLVFLSPLPWQWTGNRFQLNTWKSALPLNLIGGCLAGVLLTAGILALAYPSEEFWTLFLHRLSISGSAVTLVSVGLGWPMANLERLWAQVRAADAQVQALGWMRNRSPFPPELLVRHLRHLSSQAEDAPATTVSGILLLAQLYRTWLSMTEMPWVPLEAERDLLKGFFEAESHRSGEEIRCSWDGFPSTGTWRLPPFCLFPICASLLERGARDFAFVASEGPLGLEIRLRCQDPVNPQDPAWNEVWNEGWTRLQEAFGEQARCELEAPSTLRLFLPRMGT